MDFDPFDTASLRTAFSGAAVEKRAGLVCDAVRGMADGLRAVNTVAELAHIDPGNFSLGLLKAIRENPSNLTALRLLGWFYIRHSLFSDAENVYSIAQQNWASQTDFFLENFRCLLLSNSSRATEFFERSCKARLKGVGLVSGKLQAYELESQSHPAELETMLAAGAVELQRILVTPNTSAPNVLTRNERRALWRLCEILGPARSIALVGNGSTLKGSGLGAAIDGFDVVVRCNFPQLDGYQPDVGRRTDVMCFNESLRDRLPYLRTKSSNFAGILSVGLHPAPDFGLPRAHEADEGVGTAPPTMRRFFSDLSYSRSTTGLMALNLILFVFRKRVTLFGFDFFQTQLKSHYYGSQLGAYLGHELQYEEWFVKRFLLKYLPDSISFPGNAPLPNTGSTS